ncbi:hypothetical protein Q3G72_031850 [Acer saccharum]|nr:hypothetical protein Q3G72_031850 [Acer saccharum]
MMNPMTHYTNYEDNHRISEKITWGRWGGVVPWWGTRTEQKQKTRAIQVPKPTVAIEKQPRTEQRNHKSPHSTAQNSPANRPKNAKQREEKKAQPKQNIMYSQQRAAGL